MSCAALVSSGENLVHKIYFLEGGGGRAFREQKKWARSRGGNHTGHIGGGGGGGGRFGDKKKWASSRGGNHTGHKVKRAVLTYLIKGYFSFFVNMTVRVF